jgi:hypothetical protein
MTFITRLRTASPLFWRCFAVTGSFMVIFIWALALASAHDYGQWGNQEPHVRKWFNGLMMPDMPAFSCCGKADAYWSDSFESNGDAYVAVITDTRDDAPLGRPHIAPGTRIPIPNYRIKWDQGNPTGHGWVFIGGDEVFCYLPPGGV